VDVRPRDKSIKSGHKLWFFSFLASLMLVFAFAILINPYRLFPFSTTIVYLNDIKPKLYDYQRYVKLFDIAKQKPKTILLGSSRVLWGIDPSNTLLQKRGFMPVYNAGILGPPMYEIREYFDHAVSLQPHLKRVILGIDFFAFNQTFDGRVLLKGQGENNLQLLFTHFQFVYDFKAVYQTLKDSLFRRYTQSLRMDGRLTPAPLEAPKVYESYFKAVSQTLRALEANGKTTVKKKQDLYENFKLSKIDMDALKYIVKTCQKRNIELYLFITPVDELAAYHEHGIWRDYKLFLHQLAQVHPYWDFLTLNEVVLNNNNFINAHFIFSVGDRILKRMFAPSETSGKRPFGEYVTAYNVEHFVQNLEKEYNAKRSSRRARRTAGLSCSHF
jgi:hypothetical protein